MRTYSLSSITKRLYEAPIPLFTTGTLKDIVGVQNEMTLFSITRRLLQSGVLEKLERGKYLLANKKVNDFTIASFLYTPSYISFESALSYYGIVSQFPYEITSATIKKTTKKLMYENVFSYVHIQKILFWGYKKMDRFLIAEPEKALLDQIYMASKGIRNLHLDEYDLSAINTKRLNEYLVYFPPTKQFTNFVKILKAHIKS